MVEPEKIRENITNKMETILPKILYEGYRECNGTIYRVVIVEYINGRRQLFIERQATKRLPRGFVKAPPAPIYQFVQKLKEAYGIE